MRAGARSRRPAEMTASSEQPEDTKTKALAGQAGLRDGRESATGAADGGGVQGAIPTTSQRAISSVSGGKRGNSWSRNHRGLPPETELIGLRQVDGMAQREPC